MTQLSLLDWEPFAHVEPLGVTYDAPRDRARLAAQAQRVYVVMLAGDWLTLRQIAAATGDPEASVSARLRDCRRAGHTVERRYVANGLWCYRVTRMR